MSLTDGSKVWCLLTLLANKLAYPIYPLGNQALILFCHRLAAPRPSRAALACLLGKQANLSLLHMATLSENMVHQGSWLSID